MVGINWRHFSVPDATGEVARMSPIFAKGPAAYNATLPCRAMVAALEAHNIPAALSFHAGTHLCNQLLYTLAHVACERELPLLSGFVHVPQSPENVAKMEVFQRNVPSMDLDISCRAIEVCIETVAQELSNP